MHEKKKKKKKRRRKGAIKEHESTIKCRKNRRHNTVYRSTNERTPQTTENLSFIVCHIQHVYETKRHADSSWRSKKQKLQLM